MRRLVFSFALVLLLTGCAQFAAMTPQQKKVTAASIAGAVVLGYLVADDDEIVNFTTINEGDTVAPDGCHPKPKCR